VTSKVTNADFSFIIDKLNSRLVGWKGKLLNKGWRVTPASSVPSSILPYHMQNFWLAEELYVEG